MKILKFIGIAIGLILVAALGAIAYVQLALPDVGPAPKLTVKATPALIKRGEYLATSVTVCVDCHSTRDWSRFSGPLVPGTTGKGGEAFTHDFGFPGNFYSRNITPAGIGDWTDGELYRLITTGVTRDGEAIFPVMPYKSYGNLAQEDVKAIIAYIRTLQPVENRVPTSEADFPMNIILHTIPSPGHPGEIPPKSDQLAYGKYLTTAAACADCHTPQEKGQPIEGMYMAGGFNFKLNGFGVVRSANLTPDETGLGKWTEEQFVNHFKQYADSSYVPNKVGKNQFQTLMPWTMYGHMKVEDLKAIYAYLRSIKPVHHQVQKFTPESMLKAEANL